MPALSQDRARQLLRRVLVWDNHACMPLRPHDDSFLPQMERFRSNGADVVCLNAGFGPQTLQAHLRMLAALRDWFSARDHLYALPSSVADIDAARAAGKVSVIFDVEGMAPLDCGYDGAVERLYSLGVRWMLVAYNRANAAGGGCYDDDDPGLSTHGRAILADMRHVGMLVCCSHTGHRTVRDVMDAADAPVIFSHSNCAAVDPHPRNIPDSLIRACAATGGVVGINGINLFLGGGGAARMVRHIDHAVQLVGIAHVGISLDYAFDYDEVMQYLRALRNVFPDSDAMPAPSFVPPEALSDIVGGLIDLGYGEDDVTSIVGGNWRRVAAQVWH